MEQLLAQKIFSSALRKHEFTKHINENLPGDDYSGSSNEIPLMTAPYVN